MRDPVSREVDSVPEGDVWACPLASKCMDSHTIYTQRDDNTHMHAHIYTNMNHKRGGYSCRATHRWGRMWCWQGSREFSAVAASQREWRIAGIWLKPEAGRTFPWSRCHDSRLLPSGITWTKHCWYKSPKGGKVLRGGGDAGKLIYYLKGRDKALLTP